MPVEVAPTRTRTSWAVVCEVSGVLDDFRGCNGVDIIAAEVTWLLFCFFSRALWFVVLKRLFK